MSNWAIMSEHEWETKYRAQHGDQEYDRRLAIADRKADELNDDTDDGFAEATIMRTQFRSAVMQVSTETLAKMEKATARQWANVIYRAAGVEQ